MFCKKVFLPEKERLFEEDKKKNPKLKNHSTKRVFSEFVENFLLKGCEEIYCRPRCKWLKSYTEKRKKRLKAQGAISGCRDLMKEYPKTYKNL